MDSPGPFRLVIAAVVLVAVVAIAVTQLRAWWSGATPVSPDSPPHGWSWGATSWRAFVRGLPLSVFVLGLAASAIVLSAVDRRASGVAVLAAVVTGLVWLSVVVLARPRQLIPPAWRPDRHGTRPS